jgi:hypothetical protein
VTWVTAKPAATITIGITNASIFRYLIFMIEDEFVFGLFRLCFDKYSKRYPVIPKGDVMRNAFVR